MHVYVSAFTNIEYTLLIEVGSEQLRMKHLEVKKADLEEHAMHMQQMVMHEQTARASKDPGGDDYIICAICTAARVYDDIICSCGRGGRVCNCQNFKQEESHVY